MRTTGSFRAARASGWDAEMVRDYALAASGLLVRKIGGPSVRPYQPPASGLRWRCRRATPGSTGRTRARRCTAGASTPSGSGRRRPVAGDHQCPDARALRRAPGADQHAAAGAGDDERSAVRRGLPAPCTARDAADGRGIRPGARLRDPAVARAALQRRGARTSHGDRTRGWSRAYRADPGEAERLLDVGDSLPDDTLPAAESAAWTMLVTQVMNLDEVLNK